MKKALKIAGNVILWLFVAFAAITMVFSLSAASSKDGIPSMFGKSLITVQSDSMNPTFKKGDLIIDKALKGEERMTLQVGDVITFWSDLNGDGKEELNTHRIVEVINGDDYQNKVVSYRTQGDNKTTNPNPDKDLVRYDLVVGKYTETKIGGLGKALDFLQSSTGFLVIIVIPMALFFIYELYNLISTIVVMKQKKAGISAEDEEEIKKKAIEEYLRQQAQGKDPADESNPDSSSGTGAGDD